jgi:hypothetical protein
VGQKANAGNVPILAAQTQPLTARQSPDQTSRQRTVHPMRQTSVGILALRRLPDEDSGQQKTMAR